MHAASRAHATRKIAIGGRDAASAWCEHTHRHSKTGTARGMRPQCACVLEDIVQTFALCCTLDGLRTRRDDRWNRDGLSAQYLGCSAQVRQARVGARADERLVEREGT